MKMNNKEFKIKLNKIKISKMNNSKKVNNNKNKMNNYQKIVSNNNYNEMKMLSLKKKSARNHINNQM